MSTVPFNLDLNDMGLPLTKSNWPFLVVIRSNNVKSSDAFCLNVLMIIYPCPYFLDLLKNIVGIQMFFFRCLMSSLESLLGTYSTEMLRGNTSLKWCGPKSATQISFNHIVTNDEIGFSRYSSWPVLVDVQKLGYCSFQIVLNGLLGGHVGTIRCLYHPDFNSTLATLCKGAGVMNFELLLGLFRFRWLKVV